MIKVVDLFTGAGGLTFGFQKKILKNKFINNKQYDIVFANELDSYAAQAFSLNFPKIEMLNCSITDICEDLLVEKNIDYTNIDLVIGGPPCQSFSTVGKRQYDERAKMYTEYRRMLTFIKPKMFLFENVTGLLTMKSNHGKPVLNEIKRQFADFNDFNLDLSYTVYDSVLNAKHFGVPQNRERVFLIGIRNDLQIVHPWEFPLPTHTDENMFLTVEDAIGDLPHLENGESKDTYDIPPYTPYQKLLRNNATTLSNHINAVTGPRLLEIIKHVKPGEGKNKINQLVEAGVLDKKYYLTSGYTNSYGRLWWNRPCSTITNNLTVPSSNRCIHPLQNRALTPREGARIQSFPDTFKFFGVKRNVITQIGNAVPPLLAMALAKQITKFFKENGL